MNVYVRGSGSKVSLSDKDQLGQPGGQGTVYRKGDLAYKIYHEPSTMIPLGKIDELSKITAPNVIRPLDVLVDVKGREVGYTMKAVGDSWLLCELMTRDGKARAGIDGDKLIGIVRRMRETVASVHACGVVIADPNEMNFLISKKLDEVHFIDVDSWQTRKFPATHVMETIRDYHGKGFSEGSDWYAMGVLWFQLWIDIHPFRCIHPDHKMPITPERFTERLKAKISAFTPNSKLPPVCFPLDTIPSAYRAWMERLFVRGERTAPPSEAGTVVAVMQARRAGRGQKFEITEITSVAEDVVTFLSIKGIRAAVTRKAVYVVNGPTVPTKGVAYLAVSPVLNHLIAGTVEDRVLKLFDVTGSAPIDVAITCEQVMSYGGRLYLKEADSIREVKFVEFGTKLCGATVSPVMTCMPNATWLYEGVMVQYVAKKVVFVTFPAPDIARQFEVPEIKGRILAAKYDEGVLMVVTDVSGVKVRYVVRLSTDHQQYDVREERDVQTASVNFTVLETGVCVRINDADEVELFRKQRGSPDVKAVSDPDVDGDAVLARDGATTVMIKGHSVYSMRMRP